MGNKVSLYWNMVLVPFAPIRNAMIVLYFYLYHIDMVMVVKV